MPPAPLRTLHHSEFDAAELASAKAGRTVSVCIPARDEAATVGHVVEVVVERLRDSTGLVDEVIVVDDGSTDDTGAVARAAGATVVRACDVLADVHPGPGKGQAMWKSLHVSTGDLVCWCDADIANFGPRFVVGVLGPLLTREDTTLVKSFYERPYDGAIGEGGRVTELVARPLISRFFPELGSVIQPLSGEYGGRREVLEQLSFASGYGVDLGLLIDLARRGSLDGLVQVDLGIREHRNRSLTDLGPQAAAILGMVLSRAGVQTDPVATDLLRPDRPPAAVEVLDLPPLATLGRASA